MFLKIFIKFLLIIWYFQCNVNARKKFYIGLIIDNENNEYEIVFRSAIESFNVDEKKFLLKPIVRHVTQRDTAAMEKLTCELISNGVIAIFGPSAELSNIVSAICYSFEIPHFLFDYKPEIAIAERVFFSMTINLYPNDLALSRAYASIIQSFSWRKHSILYEEDVDLVKMQDVLQIQGPNDLQTTIRQLDPNDEQEFRPILKDLREYKENNLLINCASENIEPILRQSIELGFLTDYQSLFFINLDAHTTDLGDITSTRANITAIRIFDPTDFNVKTATYAWEQRERRENRHFKVTPENVKTKLLLLNDAVWIFSRGLSRMEDIEEIEQPEFDCGSREKWAFGRKIIDFIKGRRDEGATGRIDFDEYGRRTYFFIYILQINTDGFEQFTTYDPVNGVAPGETETNIKKKEEQIATKVFIVSSRIGKPFLFNRSESTNETLYGNDRYEGYSMDLIDEISKVVGIKYLFEIAPDNEFGGFNEKTGKWNGIVRQVMDEKADIGICDLTMTSARRKVVDFTPPFMTLGISILFSKSQPEPPDLFSFRLPFSTQVWMYMSACFFGICILVFVTARMAPDDWENPHPCEKDPQEVENVWTISNTVWLAIGSIMGQGCDLLPKSSSTRILTGMWWFFALMLLNSYTANLAAFLTKSQMGESIKNVEDLARQNKIKYGTYGGGSTMGFFKNSNVSIYQKMWSFMESQDPSVFTKDNDVGEERVIKSNQQYAFFMESSVLEYKVERNCDLVQIGSWLDFKTYGIAMPFNSPYRKLISEAVLKLGERGTLADLKRRWWKEKHIDVKCVSDDKSGSDSLKLKIQNVGGVFLVLGIGLFLAFFIGIIDFFYTIQTLALEEKLSMKEAFITEIMFALKFWITTKPVVSSNKDENSKSKNTDFNSKDSRNIDDLMSLKSLPYNNSKDHEMNELTESKSISKKSKITLNCIKVQN